MGGAATEAEEAEEVTNVEIAAVAETKTAFIEVVVIAVCMSLYTGSWGLKL